MYIFHQDPCIILRNQQKQRLKKRPVIGGQYNYGYSPKIVHRSPNTSTVLRMVSAGLGITMMGKSTLKGFSLDLKSIELSDLPYQLDMKLVWKTERENELESYLIFLKHYLKI